MPAMWMPVVERGQGHGSVLPMWVGKLGGQGELGGRKAGDQEGRGLKE